ncbi:MAG: tRNA pseudouridine(13) synthase TruD, partial [Candidatus Altarchaeaceae archaeon]
MIQTKIPEELNVWIKYYSTDTEGIGGKIKNFLDDFKVIENSEVERDENGQNICLVIEKRNINTEDVIKIISKELKINRKLIGFAGNKDKNSISIQKISLPYSKEIYSKIENINENFKITDKFRIIDKFRIKRKIRMGHLKGNSFEIIVRECKNIKNIEEIRKELKNVP